MSISSISSSQTYQPTVSNSTKSSSLSADQKSVIEDVLSQYDASSLSADDAKAIVEAFKEAGIEPSSALQGAMSASGFDAKEIGDLAGVGKAGGGGRPMGPPPAASEEELSTITDLLESLLSEDEEDTTTTSSTASSLGYGQDAMFSSFNSILDYTSQIVNLKDEVKEDVMKILDAYKTNELQQDVQNSTVNSLNQILSKPENYNRISFYV